MKKLISVAVMCAMLACAMLTLAVSADGAILWTDDFSTASENDWIWDEDTTRFFVENGKLEGWAEAVVHQSNFLIDRGAPRRYKECAFKVECAGLEDGGRDAETHGMSIWLADYISPYGDPESIDGTITYSCGYEFETKKFSVSIGFDNAGEDFKPANYPEEGPLYSVVISDAEAPVMDTSGAGAFTLGMRISGGKAAFYLNDVKYYEMETYRGAKTCTEVGSPILLWNNNLHCTFDNLVVATADYDLFGEAGQSVAPTPADGSQTPADGASPADAPSAGDNAGNAGDAGDANAAANNTPADTGAAATGGTAARTGDSAIIVIAVMIAAVGCAVAVKKLGSR